MTVIPLHSFSWEANSYLITDGEEAVLIDAGADVHRIREALEKSKTTLKSILLTHGHFDHTTSIDELRKTFSVPVFIHEADAEMLVDAEKSALYHFFGTRDSHQPADKYTAHDDQIPLGSTFITVLHTPGHSQGSVCYRVEDALFTGDTIFAAGFGRYDLYGGGRNALTNSLASLRELKQNLTIYPGHGGTATLSTALDNLFGLI